MVDDPTTYIDENTGQGLTVYPNPFDHLLVVDIGEIQVQSASMFNLQGQEITLPVSSSPTHLRFDTNELPRGMYVLQIKALNGSLYQSKVLKL